MIRKVRRQMGWLIVVVVVAMFAVIALRVDDWKRDWTTNWAETDPEAEAADLRPFHSPLPPNALKKQVLRWVSDLSHWRTAEDSEKTASEADSADRRPIQLHLVRSTRIMRFKDDVHLTFEPDPKTGGSVLHVQSRSRIGRGDLGQNPRNIRELIAGMKARR